MTPDLILFDGSEPRLFTHPIASISVTNGIATIEDHAGRRVFPAGGFDALEAAMEAWRPLGGILCGYLGYELAAELEDIALPPVSPADPPELFFGLYTSSTPYTAEDFASAPLTAPPVSSTPTGDEFMTAVERTVARIYAGELFQVNLCRRLETSLAPEMIWPLYQRLRNITPASHGAFLRLDERTAILSASPELFLEVKDGTVRSCPIKGTRPRGATPEEDVRLAAELAHSKKDRAELAMIVDVVRNDLGRVCITGSVTVASHAQLITLPTVHHTVSEVCGQLRPDRSLIDLLRASFPSASISGAPKIRAMELAAIEERQRRGPCMGAIGWIALDGSGMEFSVAIRTAVASAGRVWYLAGCGITSESDPAAELAETSAKASAFLRALGHPDGLC